MNTHVPSGSGVGHARLEVGVDVGVQIDVAGVSHDGDQQSSLSRMVVHFCSQRQKKDIKVKTKKMSSKRLLLAVDRLPKGA